MTPSRADRFWAKVNKTDTCWLWTGSLHRTGYGRFRDGDRTVFAHRWSYEHEVGPIPDGLQLDHLCRVTACVRPDHLEPVTNRENQMRGETVSAAHAAATHCPAGHAYDEANTYLNPHTGGRVCRACGTSKAAQRWAGMTEEQREEHRAGQRLRRLKRLGRA